MITLRIKTKTGHVSEMQVEELLAVDGQPYRGADDYQELRDAIAHLSGRVDTFETLLTPRGQSDG